MKHKLLYRIANDRYVMKEDYNSISNSGFDRFNLETDPLIRKACMTGTENFEIYSDAYEEIQQGIGALTAALQVGCYLDGIRDLIDLLTFKGSYDDIFEGADNGGAA